MIDRGPNSVDSKQNLRSFTKASDSLTEGSDRPHCTSTAFTCGIFLLTLDITRVTQVDWGRVLLVFVRERKTGWTSLIPRGSLEPLEPEVISLFKFWASTHTGQWSSTPPRSPNVFSCISRGDLCLSGNPQPPGSNCDPGPCVYRQLKSEVAWR